MKHARKYQWCAVSMIVSIILSALFSPYPNANRNNTWELDRLVWQVPQKTTDMAARLERIMPLETPVAVQSNLMAYLHPLRPMYHFPHQAVPVDWVVQHVFFDLEHSISLLGVPFSSRIEDYLTATKALLEDDAWQIVLAEDHWVVWHKTKNDAPKSQADKKNVQLWLHNVQKNYCMTDMCQNLLSGKNEKYQQFCKICPHSKADIKK